MRKELGVLLIEDEKGGISVQLFSEIDGPEKAFLNLTGNPGDKPTRATWVALRYVGKDSVQQTVKSKDLPSIEDINAIPDGYVLGEGPVTFKKDIQE